MNETEAKTVAENYFEAWESKDWQALRSLLSADATFRGPLASIDGADGLVEGLKRMAEITTDIVVHKRFVDGPDSTDLVRPSYVGARHPRRPRTGATSRTARSPRFGSRLTRATSLRARRKTNEGARLIAIPRHPDDFLGSWVLDLTGLPVHIS